MGLLRQPVADVVVEVLALPGLGDAGEVFGEGEFVDKGELVEALDAVGFGAGGEEDEFERGGEVLAGIDGALEELDIDGDFLVGVFFEDVGWGFVSSGGGST